MLSYSIRQDEDHPPFLMTWSSNPSLTIYNPPDNVPVLCKEHISDSTHQAELWHDINLSRQTHMPYTNCLTSINNDWKVNNIT